MLMRFDRVERSPSEKLLRTWSELRGGLTLVRREIAQIAEGVGNGAAAVRGEAGELAHGAAHLLTLLGGEMLHGFGAGNDALPFFWSHVVELGEAVVHALLHLRGQIAETGFTLQGPLLLRHGEVAVTVHPLGEMLLIFLRNSGVRGSGGMGGRSGSTPWARLRKAADGDGKGHDRTCERATHGPRCGVGRHDGVL